MIDFAERADFGRQYIEALRMSRGYSWMECHDAVENGSLAERLVLVHPTWLRVIGVGDSQIVELQGGRTFTPGGLSRNCQADVLWGYECRQVDRIQADHLWPFSLGGPTKPGNAISLCVDHNAMKGMDIHVFPWSGRMPQIEMWLTTQVRLWAHAIERVQRI